jgi:tetratricopeptide (TPR) repeat protein
VNPQLLVNLGWFLTRAGRPEQALEVFEQATRRDEKDPRAWCELAWCLRDLGRWSDAVEPFRRLHALQSSYPSKRWLKEIERIMELEPMLQGEPPGDIPPEDRALLADMLRVKHRYALSVRFFAEAFRADPSLAELGSVHRYRAMSAAAAGNRPEALAWCRAYVDDVRKRLATEPVFVRKKMRDLQRKRALAPVRDADDLPDEWQEFWDEVAALRAEAEAAMK